MNSVLVIICIVELIAISLLVLYIGMLWRYIKGLIMKLSCSKYENNTWRFKLLDKLKEKIVITERVLSNRKNEQEFITKLIYQLGDINILKEDLFGIFHVQITALKNKFPQLTELDLLVICLIGIGMDNLEIYTLLRMEKRTLYRRRQLISMRVGISSLHLDEFSMNWITKVKSDVK